MHAADVAVDAADRVLHNAADRAQTATVPLHVEDDRSRAFLIASGILWCDFFGIAGVIGRGGSFKWDLAIARTVQRVRSPAFGTGMHLVSLPGFFPFNQVIVGGTAAVLWLLRFRLEAVFCVLSFGAEVIGREIKRAVRRRRPESTAVRVFRPLRDPRFPSGHTLHNVTFYGFLAYPFFVRVRPGWLRHGIVGALVSLIGAVGPSRVYRGDHWPSDITASYCAGIPYLFGLIELYRAARHLDPTSRPWSRYDPRRRGLGRAAGPGS